jgi:transcriptional regulator with XRE-family HTH domain
MGGPTALRIQLGTQLRRLREANGVTREAAGYEIRASESKISRMELGRVSFKERDVADLLKLYEVAGDERDALVTLARQANNPGWWHSYADLITPWFQSYLGLEESASLIRTYEVQFVPGLLQTADYAKTVIKLGHKRASEDEIARRIELRQRRQQVLDRENAPQFWVVIDEGALRRLIGGVEVMRDQLKSLIEWSERPNVRLQIVMFAAGAHSAAGGPFSILRFAEPDLPDVVYSEQLTGAIYLDKRADVDHYAIAMEEVCVEAEPPDDTPGILKGMLDELH